MENTEQALETTAAPTTETATETPAPAEKTVTVTVELSTQQHAFLTTWQKTHEQELGIEIPMGAMVRKAVDIAMKASKEKSEHRPAGRPNDRRPSDRGNFKSDRGDFKSGPRKSFGGRPDTGRGGPKFDMLGSKHKTRTF